jgi:glutamate N-acetyltransferase / amino-acid N-acetyltransferase
MKAPFREIPGSILAPQGFRAAGVFCDIKRLGTGKGSNKGNKRDLAIIVSDVPAAAAAMFTTNQVCAAPVKLCAERIRGGKAQAIVVNSGNANACTGKQGLRDAKAMADLAATKLRISREAVLVASTGRIGVTLPMQNVKRGTANAISALGRTPEHAAQVAEAIMTSDTRPKQIAVEFSLDGKRTRIGGICKGAGMIQPGMSATGKRPAALHATMLSFITTDAAISPAALQLALEQAVAQSFNRITVDGDMSTNDTVLILANSRAGNATHGKPQFQAALNHVTLELAKMIVRDGEGASRFVTVRVSGADSAADADAAARTVANGALVKTSWCGGDPNWGRILGALGYSSARIIEEKIDVAYSLPGDSKRLFALRKGQPTNTPFADLCRIVAEKEFDLHINLNLGKGAAVMYGSDLTEDYVDFNKGDVTDPASLGG